MLQSLAEPRFAVPFLLLLGIGGISVLVGVVVTTWPRDRPVDAETERTAHLGGVAFAAAGGAIAALGFRYAGTMADLLSLSGADNAGSPNLIGGIGQALPWTGIALGLGVVATAALVGAIGILVSAQVGSES
ncbi:MAG: hypothetical protein ABEH86_04110 [Haloarcula sp.]